MKSVSVLTSQATSFVSDLSCFPSSPNTYKGNFKGCGLPSVRGHDVLFLRPVDDIWKLLRQFNSTQLAAMAPEHEIPKIGWYGRFASTLSWLCGSAFRSHANEFNSDKCPVQGKKVVYISF